MSVLFYLRVAPKSLVTCFVDDIDTFTIQCFGLIQFFTLEKFIKLEKERIHLLKQRNSEETDDFGNYPLPLQYLNRNHFSKPLLSALMCPASAVGVGAFDEFHF